MTEWQPIETAPKDGSEVLIFASGYITIGWWNEARKQWCFEEIAVPINNATHWMALPEPPKPI